MSGDGKGWPVYYTVVLLLFAAVFISYIDRTNISVAAVAMQDELGWNETRKGTVLSAFFVGYLLLMCGAAATFGCGLAGFAPNGFDIAPKYADVIWGISNTVATLPGIFGVFITGWLVDRTGTYAAPFLLTAGLSLCGGVFYLIFGSGRKLID